MSVRIITDSAADIPQELAAAWQITVLPLRIRFENDPAAGPGDYLDGITLSTDRFYEKLIVEKLDPKTSLIPPADYEAAFAAAEEAGDTVVLISISSGVSGTYQSALIAAQGYDGTVWAVDSMEFCISQRILVELAVRLRDKGLSAPEIAARIERAKGEVEIIALFDTLEYLKRGGRLSKASSFVGGILSIKPVLTITDGVVNVLKKARGSAKGIELMKEYVAEHGGIERSMPYCFGYTGLSRERLLSFIEESRGLLDDSSDQPPIAHVGAAVGTYAGPDAIALAFFPKGTAEL